MNSVRYLVVGVATGLAVLGATQAQAAASYLIAYPRAPYDSASDTFALTADGTSIPVTAFYGGRYSFGHLAYEGTTTFVLSTRNGAAITGYDISPHDAGITGTVSGSHLTFSVPQGVVATYLIVKVTTDEGALQPMVIAGDRRETDIPTVGGKVVDITGAQYHADSSGKTLLNGTIQAAIDQASSSGGGTVYFPAGVYKISSNIQLKSNVTLYLAAGAFLRGSADRGDYTWNDAVGAPRTPAGDPSEGPQNFVIPGGVSNVAFTGRGTIDANSMALATPARPGGPVDGFGGYHKGIIGSNRKNGAGGPDGITISGITVKDATAWTIYLNDSNNVRISNVKMVNDFDFIHSDGYDLVSTSNAVVDSCLGVTGDDVFDAKAGTPDTTMENVTYQNGVAYSTHGTGTKVGIQARGSARNITFSHIAVVAGQRAVSVSHDEGPGSYSDLHFNDIHMETLTGSADSGEYRIGPVVIWTLDGIGGTGPVSNVTLSRVTVDDSRGFMGQIAGVSPIGAISNVRLQDVKIDGTTLTNENVASKITVGANVSGLNYGPAEAADK